jgi:hypothetical protein
VTEDLLALVGDQEVIYITIPDENISVKPAGQFKTTFLPEFNAMVRDEYGPRYYACDFKRNVWHFVFRPWDKDLAIMLKLRWGGK